MRDKLSKYRIKERLTRGFIISSAIPAIAAVVGLIALIVVSAVYGNALKNYGFAQGDVGKTMTYFSQARSSLRGTIGYDDQDAIDEMLSQHEDAVANFEKSFADLEKTMISQENKDVYNSIESQLPEYWRIEGEILKQGAVTDRAQCELAQERAISELGPLYNSINEELTSIMDIKVDRGNSVSTTLSIVCLILMIAMVLLIVIAVLSSIRLGQRMAENIARPLTQLGNRLDEFAKGDLFSPFPEADSEDEVSDMIRSAQEMAHALDFIISDMQFILGKMADSDYTVNSKDNSKYIGDFRQLFESSKKLKECMVETIHFIEESSGQVTSGSGNLADTSQSLAEGATEQASAVEELQATFATIADEAARAADSAEMAYNQSKEYADMADNSNADIKEMVEAMARISEASEKIGNIISEIESIASQTNLLSLNASIEAARAGEAGRGFSVVADQIRQLAEQSSKSAVDTRTLIEGTMQEVHNGNKVADRAVASIEVIVEGIRKIADSSKELSVSSANQAKVMKEAEEGINQISDVIQTNAAVAEESSATSQQLSAQAALLDDLVAKFALPE